MRAVKKIFRYTIFFSIVGIITNIVLTNESRKLPVVVISDLNSRVELSLEDFIIYCLAYDLSFCESEEFLRARAVMIRSEIMSKMGTEKYIEAEALNISYLDEKLLRYMWGEEYDNKLKLLKDAISSTKGVIVCHNKKALDLKYHTLSNGYIRSGDRFCKELTAVSDKNEAGAEVEFFYAFDELLDYNLSEDIKVVNEHHGYVTLILSGDVVYEGKMFCEMLKLPSESFDVEKCHDGYLFRTHGIGDGYGMSLMYAKHLAESGLGFKEILRTFYKNIEFETV